MPYSEEFKNSVVSRILRKELSVAAAAKQYRVGRSTLHKWKLQALDDRISPSQSNESDPEMNKLTKLRLPKGVSYLQAHEAVTAMALLGESEFGAYCRKHGYTADAVKKWKAWFEAHPGAVSSDEHREARSQLNEALREVQSLHKQIGKKDKALAEAATMLLISKKAEAIFGKEAN